METLCRKTLQQLTLMVSPFHHLQLQAGLGGVAKSPQAGLDLLLQGGVLQQNLVHSVFQLGELLQLDDETLQALACT